MRTSAKQLRQRVERLQSQGADIAISWGNDRPRCSNRAEDRDISPRLTTGEMAIWLQAYETGIEEGRRQNYYAVREVAPGDQGDVDEYEHDSVHGRSKNV